MTHREDAPQTRRNTASVDFLRAAWKISLPSCPKAVLVALADCVDAQTRLAWPSVETLCSMTGWAERSVQRALRELVSQDLIRESGRTHRGRGLTTRWELLFAPDFGRGKGATQTPITAEKGATQTPYPPDRMSERVPTATEKGATQTPLLGFDLPENQTHQRTRARARTREDEPAAPAGGAFQPDGPATAADLSEGERDAMIAMLEHGIPLPGPLRAFEPDLRVELERRRASEQRNPG